MTTTMAVNDTEMSAGRIEGDEMVTRKEILYGKKPNKKEQQATINGNAQMIRSSNRFGSHEGCIRFSPEEAWEHLREKAWQCFNLKKEGDAYLTEAILDDGSGRLDIFNLTKGYPIEIKCNETEESVANKNQKYPFDYMLWVNATPILSRGELLLISELLNPNTEQIIGTEYIRLRDKIQKIIDGTPTA